MLSACSLFSSSTGGMTFWDDLEWFEAKAV